MAAAGQCAIAFDIDGVLFRHTEGLAYETCPGAMEALRMVEERSIPHVFLSNSTGHTEQEKADLLSELLGRAGRVSSDQMVLATTPFRHVAETYANRRVLCVALTEENAHRIAASYGFRSRISLQEYARSQPHLHPVKKYPANSAVQDATLPIECVCIFQEPGDWGEAVQILTDVLRSSGTPGVEHESPEQRIPLYISNPDFVYGGMHSLPRFTNGAFVEALCHLFQRLTSRALRFTPLGKPSLALFAMAAEQMELQHAQSAAPSMPSPQQLRFYMIGDNPKSDIAGANAAGWTSILVKTGCFKGPGNDAEHPATTVCENVLEAVQWIINRA